MKIPRLTIWLVGGVLLLSMVMAAVWMKQAEPLALIHFPNGSVLRVEAVTMGTNHSWKTKFPPYTDRSKWRRAWLAARDAIRPPSKRLRKTVPFKHETHHPCLMLWGYEKIRGEHPFQYSILGQEGRLLETFTNSPSKMRLQGVGAILMTTNIHRSPFLRIRIHEGTNSLAEFEVKNRL